MNSKYTYIALAISPISNQWVMINVSDNLVKLLKSKVVKTLSKQDSVRIIQYKPKEYHNETTN